MEDLQTGYIEIEGVVTKDNRGKKAYRADGTAFTVDYVGPLKNGDTFKIPLDRKLLMARMQSAFNELLLDFADENSAIMKKKKYTKEQKAAAVSDIADKFAPIISELNLFSFYRVFAMIDAIPLGGDLLTAERMTSYKTRLFQVINRR